MHALTELFEDSLHEVELRDAMITEIVEEIIEKGEEFPDSDETPVEFYLRLYKMVAAEPVNYCRQHHSDCEEASFRGKSVAYPSSPLTLIQFRLGGKHV